MIVPKVAEFAHSAGDNDDLRESAIQVSSAVFLSTGQFRAACNHNSVLLALCCLFVGYFVFKFPEDMTIFQHEV